MSTPAPPRFGEGRLFIALGLLAGWAGIWLALHDEVGLGAAFAALASLVILRVYLQLERVSRREQASLRLALSASAARNREVERLRAVGAVLLASDSVPALQREVARAAADLAEAESGAVVVLGREGRFLRIAAASGPLAALEGAHVPVERSLLGAAVAQEATVVVDDMERDPRNFTGIAGGPRLRAAAIVPLRAGGLVVGAVAAFNRAGGHAFTDHDVQLLQALADQVAVGLDRAAVLEASRRQEASLAATNRELERASRLKTEFLANMSHELRTPLNAIIGFSDLLLTEAAGPLAPAQRDYLASVLRNGQHLLELINNVLDLSKIEAGHADLDLRRTDLRAAIEGAVADTASLRRTRHQECQLELEGDLMARTDAMRVRQVLLNLLSNAAKFTGEGGHIVVRAARTRAPLPVPGDGEAVAAIPRDAVWVAVEDTGPGIAPADQPRLFREFSQLDGSASRRAQGTGLGLALSRRFVELHGGIIGVESLPGVGSTFWFLLPVDGPAGR